MRTIPALLGVTALMVLGPACATKKFVRQNIDPVNQKVTDLDKRAADNARAIEQLDESTKRDFSRVDEKVQAADTKATEAGRKADEGIAKANQASEKAENARTLAENSMNRAGRLEKAFENLENYQVASTKTIYFGFNKANLDDEAKKELDDLARSLGSQKRFVVEVQGYTDVAGPADYNYELSAKRANGVVRYLTLQHKIPAYRVHTIGLGKDAPIEAATKKEARKLSRRVEVRVFVPSESPITSAQSR